MLEKPEIDEEKIIACVEREYGLSVTEFTFLPLGYDLNTAVYRVFNKARADLFLKLRRGEFNQASVAVPKYLFEQGMRQVIPSIVTLGGQLCAQLPPYTVILYPFVRGLTGFERPLSERQWIEFGSAMKRFHSTLFPADVICGVGREQFSHRWRETVGKFLVRCEQETFTDPIAAQTADFLRRNTGEVKALLTRSGQLAGTLKGSPLQFILCHADIHGWNLLVEEHGAFYMVDWDTLVLAPRERDLMFIGAGLAGRGYSPQDEQALFYRGYGLVEINREAIAYYRLERIVEDIAVICEQIFLSEGEGEDRKQALEFLASNFLPGGTLETARRSDPAWRAPSVFPD